MVPRAGLVSNQLSAALMRALSEPAPAAAERIKENHSDTGRMVPRVGLEPTLLSELDFESSASTNSTTGARSGGQFLNGLARECNRIFCNFLQGSAAKVRARAVRDRDSLAIS